MHCFLYIWHWPKKLIAIMLVVSVPSHILFLSNCILTRMSLSKIPGWYSFKTKTNYCKKMMFLSVFSKFVQYLPRICYPGKQTDYYYLHTNLYSSELQKYYFLYIGTFELLPNNPFISNFIQWSAQLIILYVKTDFCVHPIVFPGLQH